MNTRLFRSVSVLVRISLVPYKYVPKFMCVVKDTYYIRIRIYAQQLRYIIELYWKFSQCLSFFWALGGFPCGKGWPHASQVCCDNYQLASKRKNRSRAVDDFTAKFIYGRKIMSVIEWKCVQNVITVRWHFIDLMGFKCGWFRNIFTLYIQVKE